MNDSFFLTWRYITFNRGRIGLLVALVTLAVALPLLLHLLFPDLIGYLGSEIQPAPTSAAVRGTDGGPAMGASVLDAVVVIVGTTSLLIMTLALNLARRFRRVEMGILGSIGCSRARIRTLIALEMLFIVLASSVFVAVILGGVHGASDELAHWMSLGFSG